MTPSQKRQAFFARVNLKKVKHMASLSEETPCYSADIYIDGALAGSASNRGNGGCDDIHGIDEYAGTKLEAKLDELAKDLPQTAELAAHSITYDAEMVLGLLLDYHLAKKEMAQDLKARLLWADSDGVIKRSIKVPKEQMLKIMGDQDAVSAQLGATVLNFIEPEKALVLFFDHHYPLSDDKQPAPADRESSSTLGM